ncbi:arginase [Methylobacter sp.]|uniref:arginase n=1 Tax=Methylobacter sp. TaxID=2051955 RepID=UPI0024882199|nr:arginase [Methylobacter sp.]MDI1277893.1 arginase [Methylobacter sp.]MDI1358721.1 arginase [Methylobacter sp.]
MAILQTLGVASCLGGPLRTCGYAAEMLRDAFALQKPEQQRLQLQWHMVYPENNGSKDEKLSRLNQSISRFTQHWTEQNQAFLVIGGDHSCALGTWGGVLNGLQRPDKFGLIWLDAHMDAHTFATSPSGNIHGMPLAALLGKADKKLAAMYPGSDFIKPENLILIGVRSYENEEYDLLKQAKVEIIFAGQIDGLAQVLTKAIDKLSLSCQVIGISIDLDFIDPDDAPGVETPAQGGIKAEELLKALALINRHPKICGLEISEFNPEKDSENKTLHLMKKIIEAFYGETL